MREHFMNAMSQPLNDDYDLNQQRTETRAFYTKKQRNNGRL